MQTFQGNLPSTHSLQSPNIHHKKKIKSHLLNLLGSDLGSTIDQIFSVKQLKGWKHNIHIYQILLKSARRMIAPQRKNDTPKCFKSRLKRSQNDNDTHSSGCQNT